jgi:RNA polymerase sigma-70 factor (ECF subfamily)
VGGDLPPATASSSTCTRPPNPTYLGELFYLEGLTYAEVARQSGYALSEVKSHIQNGKRNLKLLLSARRG